MHVSSCLLCQKGNGGRVGKCSQMGERQIDICGEIRLTISQLTGMTNDKSPVMKGYIVVVTGVESGEQRASVEPIWTPIHPLPQQET